MGCLRDILLLTAVFVFSPFLSLEARGGMDASRDSEYLSRWAKYNQTGQYDSVIVAARPVLDSALLSGDSSTALMLSVMTAQAYMFTESEDSARYWIQMAEQLGVDNGSLPSKIVFYNTKALYAIKFKLDYSEALWCFLQGYEAATAVDNQYDRVGLLTNIVNVYYLRSDDSGMPYAMEALNIVDSCHISGFSEGLTYLAMAQMHYMKKDYKAAGLWIERADSIVHEGNFSSLTATVELLFGDLCMAYGSYGEAEEHYSVALRHPYNTEPGTMSRIYLNYGKCCELRGKTEKAADLYKLGLEISNNHGNVEFRLELLRRLTDIYCDSGSTEMLRYYYRQLRESLDTIVEREREFNSLLLSNQRMRHELELSTSELELMKMRRRNMIWVFVSLIAFLLVASFYLLWRRQKRMCRILVDQHVHYVQQIEMLQAGVKQVNTPPYDDKDAAERELFLKLDAFMSKDKLFRQKDVSLDLLAQMTDSNRTYVSKAVNHYAGQSFSSWLNMYRIAEAIRLMSREDEMPLKQIADEVGYASMSVFYNAFCKETGLPPGRYRKELQNRKILPDS